MITPVGGRPKPSRPTIQGPRRSTGGTGGGGGGPNRQIGERGRGGGGVLATTLFTYIYIYICKRPFGFLPRWPRSPLTGFRMSVARALSGPRQAPSIYSKQCRISLGLPG